MAPSFKSLHVSHREDARTEHAPNLSFLESTIFRDSKLDLLFKGMFKILEGESDFIKSRTEGILSTSLYVL